MSFSSRPLRGVSPPPVYDAHSTVPTSTTSLKPYLQLPHILSLTWLAYPILSLIFIIFRLQLSSAESQTAVANTKDDLLSACNAAEEAATSAASMPRYLAIAANQQFADAVNGTMNGARAALILALTCMEAIINFLIDIYRSTFLCFLELIVVGGLNLLISAVQEITSFLQTTLNSIVTNLKNDASSINSAIESAVSAVNKVNPFGTIQAPQFNLSSFDALGNITIPTDFENALVQLNNSLPTVSSIKNSIQDLVDTPFEAVKADINNTFFGLTFDASVLPIPAQNTVSFCGNLDTSSIDNLGNDLLRITKIITIVLIVVLFLLLAGHCAFEWYKWRCLQRHLRYTREAWLSDPTVYHSNPSQAIPTVTLSDHNLLMLQADAQHPLLTRIANSLSARFRFTPSQHIHIRWFLHYIFHPPALACFLIGFFGLLSVQIQLIAIAPLEAKYSAEAAASVQDLSNSIATQINGSMYNQSASYANQLNSKVDTVQSSINNGLFGWVNGTTTTLNTTLNNFYTDVQNLVTSVFNGTVLETPAQDFVMCLIGSKVSALEEALTFLNENLNVDLPRVNDSVLVLSPKDVDEITQPIATAAIGGGQNNSSGLIGRLVATYVDSLKQERIMFAIFLGLWGVAVVMGLCIIFWHSYAKNWVELYKKRKWRKEQRDALEGFTGPFRDDMRGRDIKDTEKAPTPLRSFTPLSEPRSAFSLNPFRRSTQPQSNHPLKALEPKFEKSWDSFFHENVEQQQKSEPSGLLRTVSRSVRLLNVGKNGSKGEGEEVASDATKVNWFKSVFTKKVQPSTSVTLADEPAPRHRPRLTISTERAASLRENLPKIEVSPSEDEPVLRWSVSRTPPALPWMKDISARKSPPVALPAPERSRKDPNVPTDVGSTPPDYDPTPLAMPLHNGFEQHPHPTSQPPLPIHLALYPKSVAPHSLLAPPKPQYGRREVSSTTSAARPSPDVPPSLVLSKPVSQAPNSANDNATNPFATPFDDDVGDLKKERVTNPFAGVAL
ncbi:hypothetical protein BKA82DRAFT_131192 [Pisolithus tinctorius]|uniref:Plasma membrane fusion protein PRM1 n=1 Tax=Pisolithus tinctorius Marx 270 TaxID=870435 RepID=A0A0C3PKY2_PISTI|nr:hypothetical protein BKA82DRAFT_131192 [Pisolithus tinctorius]KIO09331.1 hypothetical protein M404DRAFT_131192 [Pisolithus tinctorius Marx 270]